MASPGTGRRSPGTHIALAFMFLACCGCGGENESEPPDAAPPDAAPDLTIGDICILLTDVTCTRDAECFDFFEPPCDESYFRWCCGDDGICEVVNGVTRPAVDECVTALQEATCEEIDTEFPEPCVGITSRDGPP